MGNQKKALLNTTMALICFICISVGVVLIVYGYLNHMPIAEHFGYVLIPIGIIEIIAQLFFTKHYTTDIKNSMNEVFTTQDKIRKCGISDLKTFKRIEDFFIHVIENNVVNSQIKLCIIYLEEVDANPQLLVEKINLIIGKGNTIEIVIPNIEYPEVRAELDLRANFNKNLDIIDEVKKTDAFLRNYFDIGQALKIIRHRQFISFPLMYDGSRWYMGSYMSHTYAFGESQYFIVAHENGENSLGVQLKNHYQEIIDRTEKDFEKDSNYIGYSSAGDFVDKNYYANAEKPASYFLGKTYNLFTHSVYRHKDESKGKRRHYLSKQVLNFGKEVVKNSINVEYSTVTEKELNKKYLVKYCGICTFKKKDHSLLILLFPEEILDYNTRKPIPEETEAMHQSPVIISGKITQKGEKTIGDDNGESMLIVHMTLFSKHWGSTQSKVGVLYLNDDKSSEPHLIENFELANKTEITSEDIVKLLLMRSSKVILRSLDKQTINKPSELKSWLNENYGDLTGELKSKEFILLYSKNNIDGTRKENLERASMKVLSNGIVLLERETENKKKEVYFGEINKRYTENKDDNKILYIKFIATDPVEGSQVNNGINQNYRELFLTVFWKKEFEVTRGILSGDRDAKSKHEKIILNSHVCFVVENSEEYQNLNKSGSIDRKINEILGAKGYGHAEYAHEFSNHNIASILRSQEIEYDTSVCSFNDLLNHNG